MNLENEIKIMEIEQKTYEIERFTGRSGSNLTIKELDESNYTPSLKAASNQINETTILKPENSEDRDYSEDRRIVIAGLAATILIMTIIGMVHTYPNHITGYASLANEIEQSTNSNQALNQPIETRNLVETSKPVLIIKLEENSTIIITKKTTMPASLTENAQSIYIEENSSILLH
jgi:hypothetical protein